VLCQDELASETVLARRQSVQTLAPSLRSGSWIKMLNLAPEIKKPMRIFNAAAISLALACASLLGFLAPIEALAQSKGAGASPPVVPAPSGLSPAAPAPTSPSAVLAPSPVPTPALGPANPEIVANIKKSLEAWTNNRYKVEEVRRTPLPGIYEARIASNVFYVDEKAQYMFMEGHMLDLRTNRDLTRERLDEIMTINFKDLPLEMAIKQVNGKGTRKIALFEDPNCGYCKKLRADLNLLPDVTVYTFAYPILSPDSDVKAKKALCAKDQQKAWSELMLTGKVPANDGTCSTPLAKIKELGRKYGITATPTIFLTSGKRIQGYMPPEQFAKALAMSN
jgi:thiol:disulfide interchange protein DsbC